MKTKLLALALVGLFAINGAMAQEQGDIRVNAGLINLFSPYGGDYRIGFGFGGEYLITDAISVAPSYYLTNKDDFKVNIFSIDGRYYFMTDDIQAYGVAGVSFINGDGGFSETGLALGAGAIFGISDAVGINAELKYQLNKPFDDALGLQANIGVVYTFGK
ncbi:outer membrane beta-barrel protein [Reichenbachiella sp.]|uniref:outer membrane beta-barrel protein n=1 Tax=Reichenbachiella sp. TaxID=2184521 RepID=UPI003BAF73C8